MTVNSVSRIHFGENKKPRGYKEKMDVLYATDRGVVEVYLTSDNSW